MFRNTVAEWGWPAKALHWIGAVAILVLLGHGWWMTHMVARPERLANYAWHAALGYDLLALTIVRLLWRWLSPVPALPADSKPWERLAAHGGHAGLYVLLFVVSATGWVVAATFRTPMTADLLGISIPPRSAGCSARSATCSRKRIRSWLMSLRCLSFCMSRVRSVIIW
jgi:cytochrome b561